MAGPVPIVRQLIVRDRLSVDRAGTYTLIGPRVDLAAEPDDEFPIALPELRVFAQVTGSFGRHPDLPPRMEPTQMSGAIV